MEPSCSSQMASIWRAIAASGLLPLAIATHVHTRTPGSKPNIERAPISPARYPVICPFGPPCWQDGMRLSGAIPGVFLDP